MSRLVLAAQTRAGVEALLDIAIVLDALTTDMVDYQSTPRIGLFSGLFVTEKDHIIYRQCSFWFLKFKRLQVARSPMNHLDFYCGRTWNWNSC